MPTPPGDALVEAIPAETVARLAGIYDRFAHTFDPFSEDRDQAERVFQQEVVNLYDGLQSPKPELRAFQRALILRCRRHLRASDKPASI